MAPSALVLLNPHAQGGRALALLPQMRVWLKLQALDVTLAAPEALDASLALLRDQPQGSRVVVVGGDGTVNRWLPAILERDLTLGLVPMGSGNDIARALGLLGLSRQDAMHHALHAPAQAVDIGWAQWCDLQEQTYASPFLSSLTAGFDSAVGLRALQGPRWLGGLPRYLWATLKELLYLRDWNLQVHADGRVLHQGRALFASSLNTPSFGSGMPAVPHARMDDGQLDLLWAGPFSRGGALMMLPRLLTGRHLSHPRIDTQAYRQLEITCPEGVPLAADGEFLGFAQQLSLQCQAARLNAVTYRPKLLQ